MAYDNYDEDEPLTQEEMLESIRRTVFGLLDDRMTKLGQAIDDSGAGMRLEIKQARREMIDVRSALGRLQSRFDNQLLVLVLGNIASGIGVAALVLGASHAIG